MRVESTYATWLTAPAAKTAAGTGPTINGTTTEPDELQLSAESVKLAERLDSHEPLTRASLEAGIPIQNIAEQYEQDSEALKIRLDELFRQNGIQSTPPIRLQSASDGSVVVAGDHPQRAEIEQLFVDHPDARDAFSRVNAQASLIRAGEESIAFQNAYRKDPRKALEEFAHLFDGSPPASFTLVSDASGFHEEWIE